MTRLIIILAMLCIITPIMLVAAFIGLLAIPCGMIAGVVAWGVGRLRNMLARRTPAALKTGE